jgi:hypothetical protein
MNMDYSTLVGVSFYTRTARVQCRGVIPPPLVTRSPPGKLYFPEYYVNTCACVGLTELYNAGSVNASGHSVVIG